MITTYLEENNVSFENSFLKAGNMLLGLLDALPEGCRFESPSAHGSSQLQFQRMGHPHTSIRAGKEDGNLYCDEEEKE